MATATLIHENLSGFDGIANCYRLDPPMNGNEFVVVAVTEAFGAQSAEATIVPAHPSGAALRMVRLDGSYVGGAVTHSGALWLAGGNTIGEAYEIVVPTIADLVKPPEPVDETSTDL